MQAPIKRSGALFKLGACARRDLPSFVRLLRAYPKQRELLEGIFDLCDGTPDGITDMPSLQEHLNIGRSTILQRTSRLLHMGLMTVEKQNVYAGGRSVNVYELQTPTPDASVLATAKPRLAGDPPPSALATFGDAGDAGPPLPAGQSRFDFRDAHFPDATQLHYHPEINRRLAWKGERFMVFALLAGLRIGRTGHELRHKETRIFLGDKWFDLEVRAVENSQIPSVVDLRVLIVVCTLIKDHLEHAAIQGQPANGFVISMTEVCQAMGMDPLPGNKRAVYAQLARWRSSEFLIKQEMYGALRWAQGTFEVNVSFSVINELTVLKHAGTEGLIPEVVHLALNARLLEALRDISRTLSVHREILHERKPKAFMHLVYYWCRRVVQHSLALRVFTLEHIRRELRPQVTLKRFRAEFTELLKEHRQDGHGQVAAIPGYLIRFDRSTDEVSICADPADAIVGERSPRNRALK